MIGDSNSKQASGVRIADLAATWPRRVALAIGTVVLMAFVALGVVLMLWPASPRDYTIKMVADIEPHRNLLAQKICQEGGRHHLDMILSSKNQGALAALADADTSSDVKLALVTGGVTDRDYQRIRLVTLLTNEPMHVMVRPVLVEGGLPALRGRRVNLGPTSTASHHLARGVLAFVGLVPTDEQTAGGFDLDTTSQEELDRELSRIETLSGPERAQAISKFPDAVMFLAPLPSDFAKRLVTIAGFQLVPIPFADAFCVERLKTWNSGDIRIDRSLMGTVVIPPYTYGGNPAVPLQPCSTLSAPLLLVAQDDTDPVAIVRVLETIHESPLKNVIHPPPLDEQSAAFPFHSGTERYLRRNDPMLNPETTAKVGSIIGGIASFASGLIGFYTFLRVRKLRRFESHYRELSRLQLLARGQLEEPGCPKEQKARLEYIESRLSELQSRVFRNFAVGGLRGESQLADMNAMINDFRERLVRSDLANDMPIVLSDRRDSNN